MGVPRWVHGYNRVSVHTRCVNSQFLSLYNLVTQGSRLYVLPLLQSEMPQNESSIMQHSPHQFRLTIITCCVLLLITAVLLPKDFYPESALHRTLNDHASINSSSLSTVPVAAPSSSILQQQHGLEEKEQQQPLSWPEAHFRMMKLGGDDAINRIPGEECGHNYKRLVEGEAIEEGKSSSSSATSSLLPICRLEDLKSNVSMGYRRSSSSPFEIPGCRLHWFHAKVSTCIHW